MESKAENVVQNIGAIAETVSIFYNSIAKQVPKDVAILLTQHFMDLTIARRSVTPAQLAQAAALADAKRRELEKKRRCKPTAELAGAGGYRILSNFLGIYNLSTVSLKNVHMYRL